MYRYGLQKVYENTAWLIQHGFEELLWEFSDVWKVHSCQTEMNAAEFI